MWRRWPSAHQEEGSHRSWACWPPDCRLPASRLWDINACWEGPSVYVVFCHGGLSWLRQMENLTLRLRPRKPRSSTPRSQIQSNFTCFSRPEPQAGKLPCPVPHRAPGIQVGLRNTCWTNRSKPCLGICSYCLAPNVTPIHRWKPISAFTELPAQKTATLESASTSLLEDEEWDTRKFRIAASISSQPTRAQESQVRLSASALCLSEKQPSHPLTGWGGGRKDRFMESDVATEQNEEGLQLSEPVVGWWTPNKPIKGGNHKME